MDFEYRRTNALCFCNIHVKYQTACIAVKQSPLLYGVQQPVCFDHKVMCSVRPMESHVTFSSNQHGSPLPLGLR